MPLDLYLIVTAIVACLAFVVYYNAMKSARKRRVCCLIVIGAASFPAPVLVSFFTAWAAFTSDSAARLGIEAAALGALGAAYYFLVAILLEFIVTPRRSTSLTLYVPTAILCVFVQLALFWRALLGIAAMYV